MKRINEWKMIFSENFINNVENKINTKTKAVAKYADKSNRFLTSLNTSKLKAPTRTNQFQI